MNVECVSGKRGAKGTRSQSQSKGKGKGKGKKGLKRPSKRPWEPKGDQGVIRFHGDQTPIGTKG
jgi:hypothetical protein